MTVVALQPATPGKRATVKNYVKTIINPINLTTYTNEIPADQMAALRDLYPGGHARLWGLSPGKSPVKRDGWSQLSPGSKVLFYTGGSTRSFTVLATITYTAENDALARALWSLDNGDPFKYLYFLDDVRSINVTYDELIPYIRTRTDWGLNHLRGFDVLDAKRSAGLLDYLGIPEEDRTPAPDQAGYGAAVHQGIESTDRAYTAVYRKEQSYLRALLIGGETAICDLCGREFGRQYLRAAHIKKRAACTEAERLDAHSVAMIACIFGCDALYESGDVAVNDHGQIVRSPAMRPHGPEDDYFRTVLKGRQCSKWFAAAASREYFDWHWRVTFKNTLGMPGH
ncbi:hypothetical protein [Rhodococcus triatomae]